MYPTSTRQHRRRIGNLPRDGVVADEGGDQGEAAALHAGDDLLVVTLDHRAVEKLLGVRDGVGLRRQHFLPEPVARDVADRQQSAFLCLVDQRVQRLEGDLVVDFDGVVSRLRVLRDDLPCALRRRDVDDGRAGREEPRAERTLAKLQRPAIAGEVEDGRDAVDDVEREVVRLVDVNVKVDQPRKEIAPFAVDDLRALRDLRGVRRRDRDDFASSTMTTWLRSTASLVIGMTLTFVNAIGRASSVAAASSRRSSVFMKSPMPLIQPSSSVIRHPSSDWLHDG